MIIYIVLSLLYVGMLLFIKPSPKSFRDKPLTLKENFLAIKGSLVLGLLLLTVHLLISDFNFLELDEKVYLSLALHHINDDNFLISQFFTNIMVHQNLLHLLSNLSLIGLLSVYERRVGLGRYVVVVLVSGLFSGLSIFFYEVGMVSSGISGVVFGLGAVFFTDEENLTYKDWLYAIFIFLLLAIMLSYRDYYELQKMGNVSFQIDYIGHFLGALGAIAYTRLFRLKKR